MRAPSAERALARYTDALAAVEDGTARPQTIEIVEMLRAGLSITDIAGRLGRWPKVVYRWLENPVAGKMGPEPRPPDFTEFKREDAGYTTLCWVPPGATYNGYKRLRDGRGGRGQAHRVAYELLVGPIPEGLTLDHLCRNRGCCNPEHLEPVTAVENIRRGGNAAKTHCSNGHPFDEANTYRWRGIRICRACHRDQQNARRKRLQEVVA